MTVRYGIHTHVQGLTLFLGDDGAARGSSLRTATAPPATLQVQAKYTPVIVGEHPTALVPRRCRCECVSEGLCCVCVDIACTFPEG